ncbi:MAG: hypothetical protein ACOY94_15440 [Bacillota bacterium]
MEILVMTHALWRWLVLLAAVLAVAGAAVARRGAAPGWANRTGLIYTISLDVQVLIGLIIWLMGRWWQGDPFYAYIHPLLMLLAVGVAHMGRRREKRRQAGQPVGGELFAYAGSLVLVMLGVPWYS